MSNLTVLNTFLCLVTMTMIFECYLLYKIFKSQNKKEKKRKFTQNEALDILSSSVYEFLNYDAIWAVLDKFQLTSYRGSVKEQGLFFKAKIKKTFLVDIYHEATYIQKYQGLFDQVLKLYAEKLNSAYEAQEKFRKEYNKGEQLRDNFSRYEIRKILSSYREIDENILKAKEAFWTLHECLFQLGFDTFGQYSYKTYLTLKKSSDI